MGAERCNTRPASIVVEKHDLKADAIDMLTL